MVTVEFAAVSDDGIERTFPTWEAALAAARELSDALQSRARVYAVAPGRRECLLEVDAGADSQRTFKPWTFTSW